jgi:hypothetical protein
MSVFFLPVCCCASGHGGFQRQQLPVAAGKGISVDICGGLSPDSLPQHRP